MNAMKFWILVGLLIGQASAAEPASTPLEVRFHEITPIKKRRVVVPSWSNLSRPIICKLDFDVNEQGIPSAVIPAECPKALHKNAVKAGLKWTFEPYQRDGVATNVRFRMVLKINH